MLSCSAYRLSHVGNVVSGLGKILCAISPGFASTPSSGSTGVGWGGATAAPSSSSPLHENPTPPQRAENPASTTATESFSRSPQGLPRELVDDLTRANHAQQRGMSTTGVNRPKTVPATRAGRAAGFTSLFMKIAWDKAIGGGGGGAGSENGLLSLRSHQSIVETLCRMRGAVLKLGQMLSIQDEQMVPAHITAIFERVRDQALSMPPKQLTRVLAEEFNDKNWWETRFVEFDETPIAAASIGQVHRARIKSSALSEEERARRGGGEDSVEVAVKVQYPGVAQSIDSDVANLKMLMKLNIFPSGLFIDNVLKEMRSELRSECQYAMEGAKQNRYHDLIKADSSLNTFFSVPYVFQSCSTDRVLISEFVPGISIDRLAKRDDIPQEFRNHLTEQMLLLTLKELFCWSFMQTDPNYANFLYDANANRVHLLDFGAARNYPLEFTDNYLELVAAAARQEREVIVKKSIELGFLSGREVLEMIDAHVSSVVLLGKPFRDPMHPFDFGSENLPSQIAKFIPIMLKLRLRPPPIHSYSLHRRLSGIILLASKLKATVPCGEIFWKIYEDAKEAMLKKSQAQAASSSE